MANTKPQVTIFDCETQETIVRDATTLEIAQIEIIQQKAANDKAEAEAKETARQAILDRLGLTADEAKLILG